MDPARTERAQEKVRLCCVPVCLYFLVSGYFVLAKGRNGEDKMRTSLVSLAITTHSDTCFSFWFQMLVRSLGFLGGNISVSLYSASRRIPE